MKSFPELTQKMWKVRPPTPVLSSIIARKLGISSIIAQILINRGIHTIEQGRCFLGGELDRLHRPLLFKDMGRAVERILKAARTGERILVYGDYDTDGITAAPCCLKCSNAWVRTPPALSPTVWLKDTAWTLLSCKKSWARGPAW
jgi:single-stranded-DNA-specific exonuclease